MKTLGRLSKTNNRATGAGLLFAGWFFLHGGVLSAQDQEVTMGDVFGLMPHQVVMSAARHPQPLKDSPSSVTVITASEIRESGATSVPQLLRNVAGLNVVQASASDWAVTSHYNAEFPATGLLVLLDGRVVYLDIFSVVPWQALPFTMEDISRIEVVKSPSSALWGANAMDGIINIVTKSPAESLGTDVSVRGGEAGAQYHSVSHSGKSGPWGYRVSGGTSREPPFENKVIGRSGTDTAPHMANGTAQVTYGVEDGNLLTLRAGISDGRGEILTPIGRKERVGGLRYLQAFKERQGWRFHGYYNGQSMEVSPFGTARENARSAIYVLELQNTVPWADRHLLTWGLDGRHDHSHAPLLIGTDREEWRGALFLQEEYKPWDPLQLSVGGRYDYFANVRDVSTGRFGAVWTPREEHTFRLAAGRSFDKPDAINQYADLATQYSLQKLNAALPDIPYTVTVRGDKHFIPARVDAVEVGYQNNAIRRLAMRVDAFLKRQKNGGIPLVSEYYSANALFPGSPGGVIPSVVTQFPNRENKTWGGEISLDWMARPGVFWFANYTLQRQSGQTMGQNGPNNRANLGFRYHRKRLSVYGAAHYSDLRYFQAGGQLVLPEGSQTAPAYLTADARLGYRVTPQVELSLSGTNIFNDVHREYADTDFIDRRVLGGVNVEF